MKKSVIALGLMAGLLLAGKADATLFDRGNGLIYDNVLNITWTQNANLCVTLNNCFVVPLPGGFPPAPGAMIWSDAKIWADNLVYQGFSDWRLPSMDVNGDGNVVGCSTNVNCPDNEYGHMYFQNLNAVNFQNKTGDQLADGGVILKGIGSIYWSSTDLSNDIARLFVFDGFIDGGSASGAKFISLNAWAVRSGDVVGVPEPGSIALLGLGLVALRLTRRSRGKSDNINR